MKKKIICVVLTGVIAATCRTIASIKPSDITIPNFTIPDSYFQNIKIGG